MPEQKEPEPISSPYTLNLNLTQRAVHPEDELNLSEHLHHER